MHGFVDAWLLNLEKPVEPNLAERVDKPAVRTEDDLGKQKQEEQEEEIVFEKDIVEEVKEPDETQEVEETNEVEEVINNTPSDSLNQEESPYTSYSRSELSDAEAESIDLGYYVVIASFSDIENARSLKEKLSLFGSDLHIIKSNNGFYRVANYVGNDVLRAERFLAEFKRIYQEDAWLIVVE